MEIVDEGKVSPVAAPEAMELEKVCFHPLYHLLNRMGFIRIT